MCSSNRQFRMMPVARGHSGCIRMVHSGNDKSAWRAELNRLPHIHHATEDTPRKSLKLHSGRQG
eukprot:6382533-Amphidinium_carterae.1